MSRVVSVERDGAEVARQELERCIGAGGVAIFPSDGLYGLASDPLNPGAIERIHALKGRDDGRPSAVMYFSLLAMRELMGTGGPRTRAALAALLPGPVTLVIANHDRRYPLASRDDPERLGVRLIEGPLSGARMPVFQTSANISGQPPAAALDGVDPAIAAGVDLAIDGGPLTGEASTVIDLSRLDEAGEWWILREGALSAGEVEQALAQLC
jgi:L-threonylcarbamoyladenylate synthase